MLRDPVVVKYPLDFVEEMSFGQLQIKNGIDFKFDVDWHTLNRCIERNHCEVIIDQVKVCLLLSWCTTVQWSNFCQPFIHVT